MFFFLVFDLVREKGRTISQRRVSNQGRSWVLQQLCFYSCFLKKITQMLCPAPTVRAETFRAVEPSSRRDRAEGWAVWDPTTELYLSASTQLWTVSSILLPNDSCPTCTIITTETKKRMAYHHKILQTAEFGWQLSVTWQCHHGFCKVCHVGSLTSDLTCCQTWIACMIWSDLFVCINYDDSDPIKGSTSSSSVNGDFVLIIGSEAHFIQEVIKTIVRWLTFRIYGCKLALITVR